MLKLLIVEDEQIVRQGLFDYVPWLEHQVEISGCVCNGLEAVESIMAIKPDVVLTDIKMPGMDGLELGQWIRNNSPDTFVIFLTGFSEFEYVRTALKLEAVDYLLKPVDEEELFRVLSGIAERIAHRSPHPAQDKGFRDNGAISQDQGGSCSDRAISGKQVRNTIAEIRGYIQMNYMHDLTLKGVADRFYINASYLSRLFGSETHTSFSDYLTACRIDQAIVLLHNPELKIYNISERVGYHSEKYFTRVFKKSMGLSPYAYRERVIKVHHL